MTEIAGFDPIAAVETLYRTDLSSSEWLNGVMASLQPLLDPEHNGLFAGFYRCPDPLSFTPESILSLGCRDRLLSAFYEGLSVVSEDYVTDALLVPGVVRCAGARGWNEIGPVRDGVFQEMGFIDNRGVVAIEPDGSGFCLSVFHKQPAVLRGVEKVLTYNIYRHVLAAHRLQRRLLGSPVSAASADAVLDPSGQLQHIAGPAHAEARHALSRAVRASEESRGARRRQDPLRALGAWESLVMGRWTFVDHFDNDGRRYILALENAKKPLGLHLLSPREREVVERALSGAHNKAIAYDLGLSHSTVKVLMSRAAFKLRVRTRHELLTKLRAHQHTRH